MPENDITIQGVTSEEINVPNIIVYKYRKWDNPLHRFVLTEQKLYYPSPEQLRKEDANECNLPVDYPEGNNLYNFFYEHSLEENPNYTREEHYRYAMYWAVHSPLADINKRNKEVNKIDKEKSQFFGVLSLCKNSTSDFMWRNYADNFAGICYGFNARLLFNAFNGGCGEVIYNEDLPHINFEKDKFPKNFIKSTYNKLIKYELEEEFRFHKFWIGRTANNIDRNMIYPPECLKEIVLGRNITQEHEEEIRNICNIYFPHVRIINQA